MNPKKDPAFFLLLLLLIGMGGAVYYYSQVKEPALQKLPAPGTADNNKYLHEETAVTIINTIDSNYTIAVNNTIDSTTVAHSNTKEAEALKNKRIDSDIKSLVPVKEPPYFEITTPEPREGDEEDNEKPTKATLVSIASVPEVVCQLYGSKKQKLLVYPSSGQWQTMYLIAPLADKKMQWKKTLIQPEYEGVSYPTYKEAKLNYKGNKYDVVVISFKGKAVDEKHPYGIQIANNPNFLIFGDQRNNNELYLYENGKVERFIPAKDFRIID